MKIFFYFITIFILTACKKVEDGNINLIVDEFPKTISLKANGIKVPAILYEVKGLLIVDSFLIVIQPRVDTIGRIFLLPNCKLVSSFGRQGKGPNEFFSIDNNTFDPVYSTQNGFTLGNLGTKIQYYRIKDIFNIDFKPYKNVIIPPELFNFRAMANLTDSIILSAPYNFDDHIIKYSDNSKAIESILDYPEEFPLMDRTTKKNVFGCYMAIRPDNTKLALTYASIGMIRIYNLVTKKLITISYKSFPTLKANLNLTRNAKVPNREDDEMVFCWSIKATEKYIYAKVMNDLYTNIADSKGPKRSFIPEIHVFDWAGHPIVRIRLSEYYSKFDVASDDGYLYTIDSNCENIINRYDLSKASLK